VIAPRLIAITDATIAPLGVLESRLEVLLAGAAPGTVAIQLRDHQLSARVRFDLGLRLRALVRRHGGALLVNDRLDLAQALEADGVHLGERSLSVDEARRLLPHAFVVRALHDLVELEHETADAVVLSPVLAARHGRPALGLGAVSEARARLPKAVRLYALGGIDAAAARDCRQAGADGVAAIGAVLAGGDVSELLDALGIAR
jgi:thiamine-phosphate pyrophosphorylase